MNTYKSTTWRQARPCQWWTAKTAEEREDGKVEGPRHSGARGAAQTTAGCFLFEKK